MSASNVTFTKQQLAGDLIARAVAVALAKGSTRETIEDAFRRLRPHGSPGFLQKAAVAALGTGDVDPTLTAAGQAVVDLYRTRTILGRVSGLRRVPALTRILPIDSGATGAWVSDGAPIPASKPVFAANVVIQPGKVASLIPVSKPLAQSPDPTAAAAIEREVIGVLADTEDLGLFDGVAAVPGGRPASILAGLVATGGGSPLSHEADVVAMLTALRGGNPEAPHFVASLAGALHLAQQRDAGGARTFPGVTARGGEILGLPLLISKAAGSKLVVFDAAALFVADLGLEFTATEEAAIQMLDNPTNDAATGTATTLVSLWQADAIAIKATRFLGWHLGDASAAAFTDLPV